MMLSVLPWCVLLAALGTFLIAARSLAGSDAKFVPILVATALLPLFSLFLVLSGAGLFIAVFTIGVIVPTLIPNFSGYFATAALPALMLGASFEFKVRPTFFIGAVGMFAVALGVPLASNLLTRSRAADATKGDRLEPGQHRPATIEFAVPLSSYRPREPLMDAPCDAVCQRLLLGREAEWVRVKAVAGQGTVSPRVVASLVYRLEAREACPRAFADAKAALPETLQAQAQGRCIVTSVADDDPEEPAGASVLTTAGYRWIETARSIRTSPSLPRQRKVEIVLALPGPGTKVIAVQTELEMVQLSLPWRAAVIGGDLSSLRLEAARFTEAFRPIDMADLLRRSLGYRIAIEAQR